MPQSRTFFKTAEGLGMFAQSSAHEMELKLAVADNKHIPIRFACSFHVMTDNPDNWDNDTPTMVTGYDRWLTKASTSFLIMAYEDIFSETMLSLECCKTK